MVKYFEKSKIYLNTRIILKILVILLFYFVNLSKKILK